MVIRIRIDKSTGEVIVEGDGFRGTQCLKPLDEITEKIGGKILKRKAKSEMYHLKYQQNIYIR